MMSNEKRTSEVNIEKKEKKKNIIVEHQSDVNIEKNRRKKTLLTGRVSALAQHTYPLKCEPG